MGNAIVILFQKFWAVVPTLILAIGLFMLGGWCAMGLIELLSHPLGVPTP